MKTRFNCVVEYLNGKSKSNFTGSVKLSFERGEVVAVSEANIHDLPTTPNKMGDLLVEAYLKTASADNFNGAIVFVFNAGKVTDYSYARTYKGDTLKNLLGA